jgi:hypothetical protein
MIIRGYKKLLEILNEAKPWKRLCTSYKQAMTEFQSIAVWDLCQLRAFASWFNLRNVHYMDYLK